MIFGRWKSRLVQRALGVAAAAALGFGLAAPASAQYGSTFSYQNPRSGQSYSQGLYYGPGYYSYGYSFGRPGGGMSFSQSFGTPPYGGGYGYGYRPRSYFRPRGRRCW